MPLFPSENSWVEWYWLPLLRDGYVLDDRCQGHYTLAVVQERQRKSSTRVSPEELANRGLVAVVVEMRAMG